MLHKLVSKRSGAAAPAAKTYLKDEEGADVALDLWDLGRLYKALRHIIGSDYVEGPAYLHFTKSRRSACRSKSW